MILAAEWYHTLAAFFFGVVAVLMMVVILLQRGKGVGLAGAFGGAGGGTAFGAKTGDVLTWITIVGAVVVLTFAVILNFVFDKAGPPLPTGTPPTAPPAAPGVPAAPPSPEGAWIPADPASRPPYGWCLVFGEDVT